MMRGWTGLRGAARERIAARVILVSGDAGSARAARDRTGKLADRNMLARNRR